MDRSQPVRGRQATDAHEPEPDAPEGEELPDSNDAGTPAGDSVGSRDDEYQPL